MASVDGWSEHSHGSSRLSQEIFSILESRFLFGSNAALPSPQAGRVRVLSIDGGGTDGGLVAATALSYLESRLRSATNSTYARIADFFDLAAGSGASAFIAAALFALRLPAAEVLDLVIKNKKCLAGGRKRGIFRRRRGGVFRRVFNDKTVKDVPKPFLVPCYDAATAAPFVFSRADAVEADMYDFPLWEVCAASCGAEMDVVSVDGRTSVVALSGGAVIPNPTAVAITHVLNNKQEFPFATSLEDIFVLSIGPGGPPAVDIVRAASSCQADIVDQSVAMAFGDSVDSNYLRIQVHHHCKQSRKAASPTASAMLEERSIKAVLFRGREMTNRTNGEMLDAAADAVAKEEQRRERTIFRTVVIKASAATPRSSPSSTSTLITVSTAGTDSS